MLNSAELYDSASGTWAATGNMATPRGQSYPATLLPSGKVLVAGGNDFGGHNTFSSAELYDPAAGVWTATSSLAAARSGHTATLLPSGRVLVAGGGNNSSLLSSVELYDPASGTWTASDNIGTPRSGHTATLLPSGRVLVAGGANSSGYLVARNCMIRQVEPGRRPAALPPLAIFTRRRCCPQAKCWWREDAMALLT